MWAALFIVSQFVGDLYGQDAKFFNNAFTLFLLLHLIL
jgi:hypothetical protein